jgi:two-component system, LytTR family, response regulator LytT
MIRILIIEDEQLAARKLKEMILSIEPAAEILSVIDTVRDAVKWLSANTADLMFLDINLSDGNSFEIFNQLEVKTPVIFTTAYDEYALKAFKVNSIDYLLKPFTAEDVRNALEKFRNVYKAGRQSTDLQDLIRMLSPEKQYQNRFLVSAGAMIKSITIEEISYFYSTEKSTFICTDNNHHYATAQSLDKVEMLVDPAQFFRVNRNFLVKYKSIKNIYSLSKSRIKLELIPKPGNDVLVSFNKSGEFRQWLGKLPES